MGLGEGQSGESDIEREEGGGLTGFNLNGRKIIISPQNKSERQVREKEGRRGVGEEAN